MQQPFTGLESGKPFKAAKPRHVQQSNTARNAAGTSRLGARHSATKAICLTGRTGARKRAARCNASN
jgi:hypothetical protein